MRFSVLLPTRDRLDLLKFAVESVRRQDYDDWEVVVSDNASIDDVEGFVNALGDPRIRYFRTSGFVSVTDNWNNALSHSIGAYVVMLGDDDCLLPGYFRRLSDVLDEFDSPDCVYTEAVQFAYPGVMPGHSKGFVQTGYSDILRGRSEVAFLERADAIKAVRKSMTFRLSFSYNMQHLLVSRRLIDRVARRGPFFQSPYPDYYASNVVMLEASGVLVVPEALVAIGITPRSFGYYYFNARADEGARMLNGGTEVALPSSVRETILPGSVLLTSWYLAMAQIELNYRDVHDVAVDRRRYRLLQVLHADRETGIRALLTYWPLLSWAERAQAVGVVIRLHLLPRLMPRAIGRAWVDAFQQSVSPWPSFDAQKRTVDYGNILDLFDATADARRSLHTLAPHDRTHLHPQ